jgi:LPXTG-motif cell wall-anchored protein
VRKFMGVTLMAVIGVLMTLPMLGAGAQTVGAGDCVVTVPPPTTVTPGTQVSISGTAPDGVQVVLFANGLQAEPQAPGDVTLVVVSGVPTGPFELKYTPAATVTLSVNFITPGGNAYTAVCADNVGRTNFPVTVASNTAAKPAAAALAFTGSSDTPSYVLIGIAAIVVGAVLVVAARRRSHLS